MRYAIVIPLKVLNDYLREALPSLVSLPHSSYEVWIVPDQFPGTEPQIVASGREVGRHPFFSHLAVPARRRLRVLPSGACGPAAKRDLAARKTKAEVLAFLDDDAWPRPEWLSVADRHFGRGVVALGGPAVTPPAVPRTEAASGLVFETFLGGGPARHRYLPLRPMRESEDWPTVNLLVRRDLFLDLGGFDNGWWPGEDTRFCLSLVEAGHRVLYDPDLVVWHHRRTLWAGHLKQIGAYGLHRGHFARRFPRTSLRLSYFLPSMLAFGLIGGAALAVWRPVLMGWYLTALVLYAALTLADSLRVARSWRLGRLVWGGLVATHLWYGLRFVQGLLTPDLRSRLR